MPCFNRKLSWVLLAMVALTIDVAQSLATNTEQIEVQAEDGNQTVEGVVLVEAIDGGVLLEMADEGLKLIQPASIVSRTTIDRPAVPESPRELGRRILGELPPGFDLVVTKHYLIPLAHMRSGAVHSLSGSTMRLGISGGRRAFR